MDNKLQNVLDTFDDLKECKDYFLQSELYNGEDVADAYMEGQIVIDLLLTEIKTLKTRLGVSERELFKYQVVEPTTSLKSDLEKESMCPIENGKNTLMKHQQSEFVYDDGLDFEEM